MKIPKRMRKEEPFMTNWMGSLTIKQRISGQLWVIKHSQFSNAHAHDLKMFLSDLHWSWQGRAYEVDDMTDRDR